MAGYIFVQTDVSDSDQYDTYKQAVPAVIAQYDGRFIVRGGDMETLEGTFDGPRVARCARICACVGVRPGSATSACSHAQDRRKTPIRASAKAICCLLSMVFMGRIIYRSPNYIKRKILPCDGR